ncbi:MAG: pseudouridine synthase [Verrucomicrobiales bacterium]|nr:pseudouridine synthase [Verrucomicrobiales bacterium]
MSTVRLQKYLSEAGVASRRTGEALIRAGKVEVNGQTIRVLGSKVDPDRDEVVVDGVPIQPKRKLYLAVHKPRGHVCSRRDEKGRPLLGDLLPKEWRHCYPVGRLDRESEGLIFVTNDGEFALRMTHPRHGVRKLYVAEVEGRVKETVPGRLTRGVTHRGERLRAEKARLLASNNTRSVVELELAEGKNREVRRLFAAMGFKVTRLVRERIGPIRLGELRAGKWRTLTDTEVKTLLAKK